MIQKSDLELSALSMATTKAPLTLAVWRIHSLALQLWDFSTSSTFQKRWQDGSIYIKKKKKQEVRIIPNLHTHAIKVSHFGSVISQDNEFVNKKT